LNVGLHLGYARALLRYLKRWYDCRKKKDMRIALVAPDIPDYACDFAAVAASRMDVTLFIAKRFCSSHLQSLEKGVVAHWIDWPRQRNVLMGFWHITRVASLVRKTNPCLVHILAEGNVWACILQALLHPIPVVTTVHDIQFHPGDHASRRVPRFFINRVIQQSSAIIVHGQSLSCLLARMDSRQLGRTHVFPHIPLWRYWHATDAERPKTRSQSQVVLFFGRISEYKGLQHLLDAAPIVQKHIPDLRVIIAGSGDVANYQPAIDSLQFVELRNRFTPLEETAELFSMADLLVLPYVEASQSGVLMAALPFAIPVVVTNVGEIGETVTSHGLGLVVPPGDALALAGAITNILRRPELRKTFAQAARTAINGRLSRSHLAVELEAVYKVILDQRSR
jgi:glycosyltransferase involved in cell wall biosynthesis